MDKLGKDFDSLHMVTTTKGEKRYYLNGKRISKPKHDKIVRDIIDY